MADSAKVKKYSVGPFVPTTSYTGDEPPLVFKGENMWARFGRFGTVYGEGYSGNKNLGETISTKILTGIVTWAVGSKTVTGIGSAFVADLHLGSFVIGDGGAGATQLLVVNKIVSDLSFICERAPTVTYSAKSFIDGDVDPGTDTIYMVAHGFSANQQIHLVNTGGALPAGLSATTTYYVLVQTVDAIKLSLTSGGAAVDITAAAGGGLHSIANCSHVAPVIFPVGTDRGSAVRGNVIKFAKGHYMGVGDGEFKVNGASLNAPLNLSRTPRFALVNQTTGVYVQDNVGIVKPETPVTLSAVTRIAITASTNASPISLNVVAHGLVTGDKAVIGEHLVNTPANGTWTITRTDANNFTLNGSVGIGVGGATGYLWPSSMRAGSYNIRVCRKNTLTSGFSNPTPPSIPIPIADNQSIKVTFNEAMVTDQDAYDIYCTQFEDNSTTTIEARYMGPWFFLKTATSSDLTDNTHTTGRESATYNIIAFADAEIVSSDKILSFDNFAPVAAEFCGVINNFPFFFSCLGQGNSAATSGTSPGPAAIACKPSNPEGALLAAAVTTADNDTIVGVYNYKSRIFALCQNSLQTLILTTLNDEPIAFRSLWNTGFRNPYNACFVKEYVYAFSNQKFIRSVAGGDDTAEEFEYASDVRDYTINWETGHVLTHYDPKNRAVIHFYAAAERRTGYWVTIALPFLLDKQVWNCPIILKKADTDFIVSGVANIGQTLTFIAGGRTSTGSISFGTYEFDGGDSESKSWYLAWNYSDDGFELNAKTIKGWAVTGRFQDSDNTIAKVYGVKIEGSFDFDSLAAGTNSQFSFNFDDTDGKIARKRYRMADAGAYPLYTIRMEGVYTNVVDRLDELVVKIDVNSSDL